MDPFTTHTGRAVPLRRSNVDTDQIIPAEYLKRVSRAGFGEGLGQLGGEFRGGGGPGRRDAHPGGQGREVERRPRQVEQAAGGVARGLDITVGRGEKMRG